MSEKYTYIDTKDYIVRAWIEKHEIFDAGLKGGARLHRFKNRAGVDYSAIYIGENEYASHERSRESDMIRWWNESSFTLSLS